MATENDKKQHDLLDKAIYELKSRMYQIGQGVTVTIDIARALDHAEDRVSAEKRLEALKAKIGIVFDDMSLFQQWLESRK